MKTFIAFVCLFALCLGLSAQANPLEKKKQYIAIVGPELCPYNCASEIDKTLGSNRYQIGLHGAEAAASHKPQFVDGQGYVIDVVKAIYEPLGYTVIYKTSAQRKSMARLHNGRYNILIDATQNRKANDAVNYSSQTIGNTARGFFAPVDFFWRYNGVDSLQNISFSTIAGQSYPELQDYVKNNHSSGVRIREYTDNNTTQSIIRELIRGKFNAIFEDKNIIDYNLHIMSLDEHITNVGAPVLSAELAAKQELRLGFSKKNPHSEKLMSIFDKGIKKLRASGKLAEIMEKYGLYDWQPLQATK